MGLEKQGNSWLPLKGKKRSPIDGLKGEGRRGNREYWWYSKKGKIVRRKPGSRKP